ncbi:restriction endonuclease subunit R [Trichothermofontia sp.]
MVQTLPAKTVTLRDLINQFGLQRVYDSRFFTEWQGNLPSLTESECVFLDRVCQGFYNLLEYPPYLEKMVQIALLSPLLFLAGFSLSPFHIRAEQSTEIVSEDEGVMIWGQLDLLVLKEGFWALVIETEEISYSLQSRLAQLLAYMLAHANEGKPYFGMLTNGASFMFVKLLPGNSP